MKAIRVIYGLILVLMVFATIGVPKGFNLNQPKVNTSNQACLKGGEQGNYNAGYCCGGTYAVELSSSTQGKDFICLDFKEYPLNS